MIAVVRAELKAFFARLELVPTVVFVAAGLSLFVYEYYGSTWFFENTIGPNLLRGWRTRDLEAGGYFYWYGSAFVFLLLVPQLVMTALKKIRPEECPETMGWGLGDWKFGVSCFFLFYGVMLALLLTFAWSPQFREGYPLYKDADRSLAMFVSYELAYGVYFVAWEYYFRGFLTFALYKSLGIWTIFVQMLPFLVMHFGKPDLEAMSSIFGAVALGYLALRTRSFWYGVAIHAATAVTLDVMVVAMKRYEG